MAEDVSGIAATDVVFEADNIEALAHETPTLALERLASGESPKDVVLDLIREAMTVADGRVPSVAELLRKLARVEDLLQTAGDRDPGLRPALLRELRIASLDPQRPAVDLLEDLLDGIRGCWLIYHEHTDAEQLDLPDDVDVGGDADNVTARIDEEFDNKVRESAALDWWPPES